MTKSGVPLLRHHPGSRQRCRSDVTDQCGQAFQVQRTGKRRIHQKPSRTEVVACQPWLIAEIQALRPRLIVCLGATAAQSLLGNTFRVTAHRGELLQLPAALAVRANQHRSLRQRCTPRRCCATAVTAMTRCTSHSSTTCVMQVREWTSKVASGCDSTLQF